ncbi:MAG: excinuclease ABC subunit UvrC [Clostridia bacterium]
MDERIAKIKNIISKFPMEPGIYMMKDKDNNIIYVGKAIILKKRVSQYFNKNSKSARIEKMTTLVENIDYIITRNEVEALVLECNYIKKLSPKFNVMLKDDKSYPYIKININETYPTMYITRRKLEDKALYFGPYTNVKSIRDIMNMIKQIFPLKRCKYNLEKRKISPCLYYHIGRCLGPCKNEISKDEYKKMINQVVMFLNGKTKDIELQIKEDINNCIELLDFEKANVLKQRLIDIEKISMKQSADNLNEISTDVIGYVLEDTNLHIQIFKIRGYKIVFHDNLKIENVEKLDLKDILISCVSQYYSKTDDIPKKIYIKLDEKESILLSGFLENTQIIVPKIGDKFKLIQMAEDNIKINLEEKEIDKLAELKEILKTDFSSIESYDISNLGNEYIVGAMIRIDDGRLNKKMYRKFKIKSTITQNDPQCIYEILSRRFKHSEWEYPDVLFIDGGITQVNAAKQAINELGIDILVFGMIKNDKHRTKGLIDSNGKEVEFKCKSTLNFITFIQDEVHRFAIRYHRTLRDKIS